MCASVSKVCTEWDIVKSHITHAMKEVLDRLFSMESDNIMDAIEKLEKLNYENNLAGNHCRYCKQILGKLGKSKLQREFRHVLQVNKTLCVLKDILINTVLSALYCLQSIYTDLSLATLQEVHCESLAKNSVVYADRDVANDLYWNCLLHGRNSLAFLNDKSNAHITKQFESLKQYVNVHLVSTANKYGIDLDDDSSLNLAYIMNLNNFKLMLHMHTSEQILTKFVYVHGFG